MAHPSIPDPEGDLPESDASAGPPRARVSDIREGQAAASFESDLSQLTAKFASDAGGNLSAELSADLALEVVLNEIVEQACLATGATGAAIILERDGEMVCRASTGENAPELGARLGNESGLTAECIRTRQAQRCDDAQTDPRVDSEACLSLGVRSVFVLPLVQNDDLVGVFELFSPHPSAFKERDERTVEALSHRMLKILGRSGEPEVKAAEDVQSVPSVIEPIHADIAENIDAEPAAGPSVVDTSLLERGFLQPASLEETGSRGLDILTWVLAAAVAVFAVWLTVIVGQRLIGRPPAARSHPVRVSSPIATAENQSNRTRSGTQEMAAPAASGPQSGSAGPSSLAGASSASDAAQKVKSALPAGSLRVYQNGKEIFTLPPNGESGEASQKSVVQPAAIYELAPEMAEGSLVYRVEPDYPEEARQQEIQGPVVLEVRAGRDGAVQGVNLLSGPAPLADAAIAAVKHWRFKPHVVKGRAVEMQTRVTLNFRLPR